MSTIPGRSVSRGGMVTLRIIWGAMLFSLVIYLSAALLVGDSLHSGLSGESVLAVLRGSLYAVSVAVLFITGLIRRAMLRRKVEESSGSTPLARYTTAVIVSLALSESIGIYGLILFLLGKDPTDLWFLIGLSAAAMIHYRPRSDELAALGADGDGGRKRYGHEG